MENSGALGLFTEEQINYVNSVPDSNLRGVLLHQIRLRDNMEKDRDAFEQETIKLKNQFNFLVKHQMIKDVD